MNKESWLNRANDLIIDVGMHTGLDTEFYLKKGFRVVAIEANPKLVSETSERLKTFVEQSSLQIINVAISDHDGLVDFYINLAKEDWGTISGKFVARNEHRGTTHQAIEVKCIQFEKILEKFGIPYYLKIDIEGADDLCLQALQKVSGRPKYLSIEANLGTFEETFTQLAYLWFLGYRQFKVINQASNWSHRCPNPPLEGKYVDVQFSGLTSGPFGEETPGDWLNMEKTLQQCITIRREDYWFGREGIYYKTQIAALYKRYCKLVKKEPVGWYDFHAKLA